MSHVSLNTIFSFFETIEYFQRKEPLQLIDIYFLHKFLTTLSFNNTQKSEGVVQVPKALFEFRRILRMAIGGVRYHPIKQPRLRSIGRSAF
ncbi:hypothetical protein CDAR_199941 [Caerostris darwini]|uniref:Maturase K n=1 Tax=Caerostris darwini TaxID=1538125 RepID=A0AAV4QUE6_9ARAC|nr:hypothetical protein CDAR_199941 [Caerostris darwini]